MAARKPKKDPAEVEPKVPSKGRGRPKDPRKRQSILEVARGLFFKSGFEGTSMDRVAEAAGVSKATLYSHFGDKEGLFREVFLERHKSGPLSSKQPEGSSEILDIEGLRNRLYSVGVALVGKLSSSELHERTRLLIHHSSRDSRMAAFFYESAPETMQRTVAGLLERASSLGYLQVVDPLAAAEQLIAIWMGMRHIKQQLGLVGPRSPLEIESHARSCVDMFLRAYRTDPT